MKAYWISPGPAGTAVELRETAAPEPKAGEILVRVRAASLNRGELAGGAHGGAPKPGGEKIVASSSSLTRSRAEERTPGTRARATARRRDT